MSNVAISCNEGVGCCLLVPDCGTFEVSGCMLVRCISEDVEGFVMPSHGRMFPSRSSFVQQSCCTSLTMKIAVRDLGEPGTFLGMKIKRKESERSIPIARTTHISNIAEKFGATNNCLLIDKEVRRSSRSNVATVVYDTKHLIDDISIKESTSK